MIERKKPSLNHKPKFPNEPLGFAEAEADLFAFTDDELQSGEGILLHILAVGKSAEIGLTHGTAPIHQRSSVPLKSTAARLKSVKAPTPNTSSMFSVFLCKTLFPVKRPVVDSTTPLLFLHNNSNINNHSLLRFASSKGSTNQHSFTITYLVNSCGLSPEAANSASERVHFKTSDRPDSVLNLLRIHGFSKTHISNLVRKRPVLLLANPEETLLPKLEFFQSIGVSKADLARTLSLDPTLLTRSLENQIVPSYNFLKSVLHSNEKVASALRRSSWIFLEDHSKNLVPNIGLLREKGVPQSCIALLLAHFPEAVMQRHDQFNDTVKEVEEMGFNPLKSLFVLAIHAISGKGNKLIWDRSYKIYKRWGWSNDDILSAFRKHPQCMILSEKKIMRGMNYLVNKMGWPSGVIVRSPAVLFFSLEKRIIPRCSVIQVLALKGLIKKDLSLSTVLVPVEKCFLERFVNKYLKEVPQLLSVYQGKIGVLEV